MRGLRRCTNGWRLGLDLPKGGFWLLALLCTLCLFRSLTRAAVLLPVEVVGEDGVTQSVSLEVPSDRIGTIRSLRLQVHGLEYADMASIQINGHEWVSLNNTSVSVAEPAKSYGGIGGGFATLKLAMPIVPGTVNGGLNTIRFRFNRSNGVASGFRVLDFNFVGSHGEDACPPSAFKQEDPNSWVAPLGGAENSRVGEALWRSGPLVANNAPGAPGIHAHCADCHSQDGRDLKYFNYSNASIIARSRFHGLSQREGELVASYIRSLNTPNPGRPWNPPYQPGPGMDSRPVAEWAAGAGLEWVLDRDSDTLNYLFNPGAPSRSAGTNPSDLLSKITPSTFRPDGDLNAREIPISFQLPDWNHWLPRVHPLDAWGADFTSSEFAKLYQGPGETSLRGLVASGNGARLMAEGGPSVFFERWTAARNKLLKKPITSEITQPSPELITKLYATQLWELVKAWEVAQELGLEGQGGYNKPGNPGRGWYNTIPAETAPAATKIPDGPNGMDGSALANEYFDSAWYELQLILNCGQHRHHDKRPIDWVYFVGRTLDLQRESHRPEPARALVAIIKAMQSTDPHLGPENVAEGWRPNQNIDPTILVAAAWQPVFGALSPEVRKAVVESMLEAWLDKNAQYPTARYFILGRSEKSYIPPAEIGAISGGKAWDATPQFQAVGVKPWLIKRLGDWGHAYADMASRYNY